MNININREFEICRLHLSITQQHQDDEIIEELDNKQKIGSKMKISKIKIIANKYDKWKRR